MADSTYDKLLELIITKFTGDCTLADAIQTYIYEEYGEQRVDREYDIPFAAKAALDAIWPEIERREHHYKVTLARLMVKLKALAGDAEA